jgi:uncharacterized protein DUF3471
MQHRGRTFSYEKASNQPPKAPEPLKPHFAIRPDTKSLDAYAGHYEFAASAAFPTGAKMTIWREGDQLVGQAWGQNTIQGTFDIYSESETNFFVKINGSQLTFLKNERGLVVAVVHHSYAARFPDCEGKKVTGSAQ